MFNLIDFYEILEKKTIDIILISVTIRLNTTVKLCLFKVMEAERMACLR